MKRRSWRGQKFQELKRAEGMLHYTELAAGAKSGPAETQYSTIFQSIKKIFTFLPPSRSHAGGHFISFLFEANV